MLLVTYIIEEQQRLGVMDGRNVYDIQRLFIEHNARSKKSETMPDAFTSMLDLLKAGHETLRIVADHMRFVQDEISPDEQISMGLVFDLNDVTLRAPISNPGKLIAVGGNFPSAGKLSAPDYPILFLKPASTIIGPDAPILVSNLTSSVAYEVELAVVIGKPAHNLDVADALGYVAGYCLANDLGDRLLEKRTSQWTTGKMFDTFTPLGPAILTADELTDTHDLRMETRVNGDLVQKGNTDGMFFDVAQLVSYISSLTSLAAGDVILTGSPKLIDGNTPPAVVLKPGDTVMISIDGLGELINPVEAEKR